MMPHLISLAAAVLVFLLTAKPIYRFVSHRYADRLLARYELKLEELLYSYEEITYYVNIPTNNPHILKARREDLKLELLYSSPLTPRIKGVRVYLSRSGSESMQIAYLPIDRYCIPLLRIFIMRGEMSRETYRRIVESKLMRKKTVQEILDEVHKQLHRTSRVV